MLKRKLVVHVLSSIGMHARIAHPQGKDKGALSLTDVWRPLDYGSCAQVR